MKLYEKLFELQMQGHLKVLIEAGLIAPKVLTVMYVCSVADNGGYGAVKRLCKEMRMSRRTYYRYRKYGNIEV